MSMSALCFTSWVIYWIKCLKFLLSYEPLNKYLDVSPQFVRIASYHICIGSTCVLVRLNYISQILLDHVTLAWLYYCAADTFVDLFRLQIILTSTAVILLTLIWDYWRKIKSLQWVIHCILLSCQKRLNIYDLGGKSRILSNFQLVRCPFTAITWSNIWYIIVGILKNKSALLQASFLKIKHTHLALTEIDIHTQPDLSESLFSFYSQ